MLLPLYLVLRLCSCFSNRVQKNSRYQLRSNPWNNFLRIYDIFYDPNRPKSLLTDLKTDLKAKFGKNKKLSIERRAAIIIIYANQLDGLELVLKKKREQISEQATTKEREEHEKEVVALLQKRKIYQNQIEFYDKDIENLNQTKFMSKEKEKQDGDADLGFIAPNIFNMEELRKKHEASVRDIQADEGQEELEA